MRISLCRRASKAFLPLVLFCFTLVCGTDAWSANMHYPNGAEDFMSGAAPPPGLYLKNYIAYITKDKLVDNSGNKVVDLDVSAKVMTPRFIYVTPWKLFGADYLVQLLTPIYQVDFKVKAPGAPDVNDSGLGDITVTPFGLSKHFGPNFHAVLAEDITLSTGHYDAKNPATTVVSRNNTTFETVLALTYLDNGFDVSSKFMFDVSTKSDGIEWGNEFHFDWGAGYNVTEDVTVGASGYAYWQLAEDKKNGVSTGGKGEVYGAGPTIKYWPKKGPFSATAKYQTEFGGKNVPVGDAFWLNIIYAF